MTFLGKRFGRMLAGLFAGVVVIAIGRVALLLLPPILPPIVSPVEAVEGTLSVQGNIASFSGTFTQAGNQPIRTAFGPLRLDYKSGPNAWTTGLLMREGDGNVTLGACITSADFNSQSKLRVLGVVESTTGGFKFPDGTTQTTAASAAVGGGWTDGGTNVYLTTTSDNVGIGTTGTGEKLEVAGNIYVSGAAGYIRFPHAYSDGNDGKIGNSMFAQGLNLVGINNDNTYRKIQIWG